MFLEGIYVLRRDLCTLDQFIYIGGFNAFRGVYVLRRESFTSWDSCNPEGNLKWEKKQTIELSFNQDSLPPGNLRSCNLR